MKSYRLLRTLALMAAVTVLANVALAANFSFTGSFVRDDDHRVLTVQLLNPATLTIRTWSYAGGTNAAGQVIPRGGFDPFISVFDSAGNLIALNNDGTGFVAADPHTGAAFDSYLSQPFAAGTYTVVLTQSDNEPNGATLADGFHEDGNPNFTAAFGCGAPRFCDITPDSRNPNWALDIDNASGAITQVPGSYLISYAANVSNGASFIDLTNSGTNGGQEPAGDVCANLYVFDPDQELVACCACQLTPNHLQSLSVKNDLTNNLLTPGTPSSITVALLASTFNGSCDAATVTTPSLVPGLGAWSTTTHQAPGGSLQLTETHFLPADLSLSEFQKLTSRCAFIESNGSGYGLCNSCKSGAQAAARR